VGDVEAPGADGDEGGGWAEGGLEEEEETGTD